MPVPAALAPLLLAALLAAGDAPAPDLSTPRRALQLFIDAGREGDYPRAAGALDLGDLPAEVRDAQGPRLARQLKAVLDQQLWIDWEQVPDAPGDPGTAGRHVVGTVPLEGAPVPIALTRPEGSARWRLSRGTVARIAELHARHGPGALVERLPESLRRWRFAEMEAWQWLGLALFLLASLALGWALAFAGLALAGRVARRTEARWDDRLLTALRGPVRFLCALLLLGALVPLLRLAVPAHEAVERLRTVALIVCATWLGLRGVAFVAETALDVLIDASTDEGRRRGVRTQVTVLRRIASVAVGVIGAALVLTQFEVVRHLGVSLLASAGIAGIVVGLAAQRPIATLLSGLQLSLSQPIRIGDTVIVEGEWGWIEEIHLTYVVVKVWDLRRLIVPVNTFLEKPFQNWTKVSPDILGTVELPADYATPVAAVREELSRLVQGNANWDGKVVGLQVTAASERTITLRALVSSPDSGKNWDLRCEVREGLVAFLQGFEGGRYLPRARLEAAGEDPIELRRRSGAA